MVHGSDPKDVVVFLYTRAGLIQAGCLVVCTHTQPLPFDEQMLGENCHKSFFRVGSTQHEVLCSQSCLEKTLLGSTTEVSPSSSEGPGTRVVVPWSPSPPQ